MIDPPLLGMQSEAEIESMLIARAPGYTPEWTTISDSVAWALTGAYARYRALLDEGIRLMPQKLQAAMLDMLGLQLLPARGARVPVVFTVSPESAADVTLAAGSQVAATAIAQLPSLEEGVSVSQPSEPPLFATEQTVTLTPARLECVYSIDPGSDRYADHSALLTSGFETFSQMELTPHQLYLGHDTLFALGGTGISLIFSFVLDSGVREPLVLQWEYFSDSDWIPLPYAIEDDTTGGLVTSGQVTLTRSCGPNAKKKTVFGQESFWIRASLVGPLPATFIDGGKPAVNDIRVRVKFSKADVQPEAAFADGIPLDTSKAFYPFGERPGPTATFYLASNEVFARSGAHVRLAFALSQLGVSSSSTAVPVLIWEYTSADGWKDLGPPEKFAFTDPAGAISFDCPADWMESEVNGTRNRWLRARIQSGDFGKAASYTGGNPPFVPETYKPPLVVSALLAFDYLTEPEALQHCITYNDFRFEDATEAELWPNRRFQPFKPIADRMPAIHFGFDRKLPRGLVSMYFQSPVEAASPGVASPFQWEYLGADGWHDLPVLDESAGFQRSGMIQFVGTPDSVSAEGLGGPQSFERPVLLYRIRARLRAGEAMISALGSGIWLNAVWAVHQRGIERELLGRSTGNPTQTFQFANTPVLEDEVVEVDEWSGIGDSWKLALANVAQSRLRYDRDPSSGEVVRVWVRWSFRRHLHDAGPDDRVYTLERATGTLSLGQRVPLAGQRLVATYKTGGGIEGNVGLGVVSSPRLVQAMITGARNPVAAAGGASCEPLAAALRRGPQVLRHRNRALAAQDIEWLALEASPEVARARCLPLVGPDGKAQRGCWKVLVVPHSTAPKPIASQELARGVQEFLSRRGVGGIRIVVQGPHYLEVGLRAIVIPQVPGDSALVEQRVRDALRRFLHPLAGNAAAGWQFGEAVAVSRIAALVEAVDGVAWVSSMTLTADGVLCDAYAQPDADELPCEGAHELMVRVEQA